MSDNSIYTVNPAIAAYKAASSRRKVLPAFKNCEIETLLNVPDRSTPVGKRDYAILLLSSDRATPHTMCVIQGTSGSGKSTLLNCIGGLDLMDSGSIQVDGKEIFGLPQDKLSDYRRENLGFIFQSSIPEKRWRKNNE